MNSGKRRKVFVIVILLAVVGATVYGFYPRAVNVDLVNVGRGQLQVTIEEEGRTRLKDRFVLSAPTAGYLQRIGFKVGDSVKRGQTVFALEPLRSPALDPRSRAEAQAQVAAAQAALNAAIERERAAAADAEYIEQRRQRLSKLYAGRSIAKDQLDQIESEAKKARALRLSAQASVDVARSELERVQSVLRDFSKNTARNNVVYAASPVGGSILRIYRESEGAVNVGEPLLDIGNAGNLEVRVEVLSSDAVRIKVGTPVLFKRWGGEGVLAGVVRVVEPSGFTKISSLGVEEQRVLVIADITSPREMWRSLGDAYRLEAHFIIWEGKDVLQVPAGALFRSGNGWAVFVAENGRSVMRKVEVGRQSGLSAQIISGLKENEKVIDHPDDAISDGTRIRSRK
jgi:HlyD family secretion protein